MTRLTLALLFALACAETSEDAATVRRDVLKLQEVLASDRSPALMVDVEHAVSGRKPVHAATMIEGAVLPEVRAQIARVRAVELATVSVRKHQLRLIGALEKRQGGLTAYRAILATGSLDTPATVDALRMQRDAESELLALDESLSQLRPSSHTARPVQ